MPCCRCTQELDLFGQLPCPGCYPACRSTASGMASPAPAVGSMDWETGSFTFRGDLASHYIACDMGRVVAGHPRPWLCGNCGAEYEDSAEMLFPGAGERKDLELLGLVQQMSGDDDSPADRCAS